jgi:hypothetical protein
LPIPACGSVGHILDLLDSDRLKAKGLSPEAIVDRSVSALVATLEATRAGGRKGFAAAAAEIQSLGQNVETIAIASDSNGEGKTREKR